MGEMIRNMNRLPAIDQFRGFAILTMVLANYMGGVQLIPGWLKHAPDIGLTMIDLVAPFFIFAIGLTYGLSFHRRLERDGAGKTYGHFATRYLALIGLGAVISAGETALGENPAGIDWGVLQAIGAAGLLALLVIRLPAVYRWLISAGVLIVYQGILDHFLLDLTLRSPHGGLFGSVSWGAMLILGTALADLFHDDGKRKWFLPVSLAIFLLGIGLAFLLPVSKHRVSSSYVLISTGASALLFALFYFLAGRFKMDLHLLNVWGKNPLFLYLLHYLLIGIFYLPGIPFLYTAAPLWLVLLEIIFLIFVLTLIAYWMERRNIIIKL
jgi:predicted acyltransferase